MQKKKTGAGIDKIRDCYKEAQAHMAAASANFPWHNKEAYMAWLVDTYCYAVNTTRILAGIGYRLPLSHTQLSNRFVAHAAEEKGHERLLENDVKGLGHNITQLTPSVTGQAFHQSLYYWLSAGNPLGIFGWVLTLEGFAITEGPRLYEECVKAHGPKTVSFLKVHAAEDIDHVDKAFKILEGLTEEEYVIVDEAIRFQSRLYAQVLNNIAAEYGSRRGKQAA